MNNLTIEMAERRRRQRKGWQWRSRWRWTGAAGERKGVEGLNGHWKPLSSSLRKLSQTELRSLMPEMASMS